MIRAGVKSSFLYLTGRKNTRLIQGIVPGEPKLLEQGQGTTLPQGPQRGGGGAELEAGFIFAEEAFQVRLWREAAQLESGSAPGARSLLWAFFTFPGCNGTSRAWLGSLSEGPPSHTRQSSTKPVTPWELLKIQST